VAESTHKKEEPVVITSTMLATSRTPLERARMGMEMATQASARRDTRIDFEQGMSYFPPFTLMLIAAMVGVFVWELEIGALESQSAIIAAGALSRAHFFNGEHWRLLSAGFLHDGWDHLVGNCVSLYILGMACEHGLGTMKTALVYVAALLAGSWMSMMQHPGPSVGASGAIFGIMGAVIVILIRWRRVFHVRDARVAVVILGWAGYTLFLGQVDPVVDNAAHIGGLLAGSVLALGLRPGVATLVGTT